MFKCQLDYFSHSCPSVHTEATDKSNKTPNYAVHSYTNHFRIASGMMSKIKYFAHRKLFMLKFKGGGKSKNAAPQLPLTEIRYLQEKRGKIRGGSRKNFDILKIATPQAAPKDHTQKLQLCYERTIEGYYFLWHFN